MSSFDPETWKFLQDELLNGNVKIKSTKEVNIKSFALPPKVKGMVNGGGGGGGLILAQPLISPSM